MECLNILIVHNYYQFAGGEDTVVAQDAELLRKHGHNVIIYKRNNEELKLYSKWKKLFLPLTTFFSVKSYREVRKVIRENHIDIVHVHNTLPLISYSVYYAAKKEKVKLIQTLHNFRMVCPNAMFYRNNHICEECIDRGLHTSIKYGCYRNSKVQTAVVAITLKAHRIIGTFHKPDAYIALTQFNKDKISTVVDADKIYVKPNYLNVVLPDNLEIKEQPYSYFVYAARLEMVKGIFVLLEAFKDLPQERLILLGTGPEEQQVREYIARYNMTNVICQGFTEHEKVLAYISKAKAVIYPSLWYEGFPMTIVESFACGTPVIASDTPNLSERIHNNENGFLFIPGNSKALRNTIESFYKNSEHYSTLRANARYSYEEYYTEQKVYDKLLNIYIGNDK